MVWLAINPYTYIQIFERKKMYQNYFRGCPLPKDFHIEPINFFGCSWSVKQRRQRSLGTFVCVKISHSRMGHFRFVDSISTTSMHTTTPPSIKEHEMMHENSHQVCSHAKIVTKVCV